MESNLKKLKLSVIIPYQDNYEITKTCLDTLALYTSGKINVELFLIDEGSEDKSLIKKLATDCQYIRNDIPVGWCKSINLGLDKCTGDYILISNNDVVFTPNWIDKLINHFDDNPNLGLLGPTTNNANSKQHIQYNNDLKYESTDYLQFFCVLLSKKCFEKVGFLDERFGLGGQDDADYCFRAIENGFDVGIARDTFIYHYGSCTFRKIFNVKESKEFAESRIDILNKKYNKENILIIGNGPSVNDHAIDSIDSFNGDILRLNNYQLTKSSGSRIDVFACSMFNNINARYVLPETKIWQVIPGQDRIENCKKLFNRHPDLVIDKQSFLTIGKELCIHPSSGLMTILITKDIYKNVFYTGFDFFQGENKHYWDNEKINTVHNGTIEKEIITNLSNVKEYKHG